MSFDELLEYLELDAAEEFVYFENLADLMETDGEISPEVLYMLLERIDMETFGGLLEDYFEDLLGGVPDDALELYTLLDTVKMAFIGMAAHIEEERDLVYLADEIHRFRTWFLEPGVLVTETGEGRETEQEVSVRDALMLYRMENLGGTKYDYEFGSIADFEMDQYTVSFADLAMERKSAAAEAEARAGDGSIQGPEGYDPDSFIEVFPEDFSGGVLH